MRIINLILLSSTLLFSGCSLLPRLTFDKAGVTPTSTEKSSNDMRCKGEITIDKETGNITCSKGFFAKDINFKQVERKYTLAERVANFIRSLAGWGFWALALALIFVPGLAGWLIGRVFNIFHSALSGTVKAISNFKKNAPKVTIDGVEMIDPKYLQAMDALLDELETEHSKDPAILKAITDMRLRHKIEDND